MNISDYTYTLPPERIAYYPLPQRDASRLLVYRKGELVHAKFTHLSDYLPDNAFLFFNNTKVIPARLLFRKESGASIEIFLLHPVAPSRILSQTMEARNTCTWQCTIGNLKKWPQGINLKRQSGQSTITATLLEREEGIVQFSWQGPESFAEIIRGAGETPLPPYIKRRAEVTDVERYQTIFSAADGAVAAPTAGLHFTPDVFSSLKEKGIGYDYLTLHVSAGTFQPIKGDDPEKHTMHEEQVIVSRTNIENLLTPDRLITAVGTTSLRTLESIYWFGVKLLEDPDADFVIHQEDPYKLTPNHAKAAIGAVLHYMERHQVNEIVGETSIYIRPGYEFRVCRGLITNFHQPASTLILLVAAFVGTDWKNIYDAALAHDYRFLSYGDSSLLIP